MRVVKLNMNGDMVGMLGGPGKAPGQFDQPGGIAVDSAEQYVNWFRSVLLGAIHGDSVRLVEAPGAFPGPPSTPTTSPFMFSFTTRMLTPSAM